MLYTLAVIILAFWLLGLLFHILGAFINLLLIVALVIIVYRVITGRKPTK